MNKNPFDTAAIIFSQHGRRDGRRDGGREGGMLTERPRAREREGDRPTFEREGRTDADGRAGG